MFERNSEIKNRYRNTLNQINTLSTNIKTQPQTHLILQGLSVVKSSIQTFDKI